MHFRRSSAVFVVLGGLLIAAAAVIRLVLVPYATQLPGDLDSTAHYEGTADFLDPAALQNGDIDNLITRGVPITLDRRIYVTDTDGDKATVNDDSTLNTPAGPVQSNLSYEMDRTTLNSTLLPKDPTTNEQSGLTVSLPLHPPKSSELNFLDATTRTSVPLVYVDDGTVANREIYNYRVDAEGSVRDPAVASSLPPALPKALITALLPTLPQDIQNEISSALAVFADPVPLTYTADTDLAFSADAVTGAPIAATTSQKVIANVTIADHEIPLLTVTSVNASMTPESTKDAAEKSQAASQQLTLIGTAGPIVLAALGLVLIAIGWVRRQPKTATG